MRRSLATLMIVLSMTSVLLAQSAPVATIKIGSKTEIVTKEDFDKKIQILENQSGRSVSGEEKKKLLQAYINEVLFYQASKEAGIKASEGEIITAFKQKFPQWSSLNTKEFKDAYKKEAGVSWEETKPQIERSYIIQKYIKDKVQPELSKIKEPTESELREFYNKNKSQMVSPDLVLAKHIFFSLNGKKESNVLAEAKKIKKEIEEKKITFEEAIKKYSEDESSKAIGGVLGGNYLTYNNPQAEQVLGDDFINKVMNMEEKDISSPLKSNSGYHLIYIEKKIPSELLSFDGVIPIDKKTTVKEAVKQQILLAQQQMVMQKIMQKTAEELHKRATIQILDSELK